MGRTIDVTNGPLLIVYQDVFHLKSLYILIYEWCLQHGWQSCQGDWEQPKYGGKGDKNPETTFYDSRDPGNKKMWIWWRLQKETGNSYYRYFLNIDYMFLGWKDVEVMFRGSKQKLQNGELTLFIKSWIELDYGDKWANHPFLKYLHPLFDKRIFLQDFLKREELLLQDIYDLQSTIKRFLEAKTFTPDAEILYEPRRKFG